MKLFIIKFIFIILALTLCKNIYASGSSLWIELHNDWYSIDNVEIKDYDSYIENRSNLYLVDIFHILKQYDRSIEGDSIRIHRTINKIEKIIELFIYVRSVIPMISLEFNGRNLHFSKPSGNEYLFKIDYSLWQENNLITLSVPGLEDLPKRNLMPAVFIVTENNINRLRNLIVQVPDGENNSNNKILLNGPMLVKKIDDKEYELFSKNPKFYYFNDNSFWRTIVPSGTSFLLKNSKKHTLVYKFNFEFQGDVRKKNALSIGLINGADEVYINKKMIGKTGIPGILSKSYYDKKRNYLIPTEILKKKGLNSAIIITHGMSDYVSGEILSKNMRLTESENFTSCIYNEEKVDLVIIIILIVLSFFSLIIFHNLKYKKEYLFLTLVLIDLAVYLFFNSQIEYLISDDFILRKRGEFISLFLLVPLITLFFRFYYSSKFSIFEKFINAIIYINLILQFVLLLVPVLSNEIRLYHNSVKYFYTTCIITFFYIFCLTIRDILYYSIFRLYSKGGKTELLTKKIEVFLHSARNSWNIKMKFLPIKLKPVFQVEIYPLTKIMQTYRGGAIFSLFFLLMAVGDLINNYQNIQRIYATVQLFENFLVFFLFGLIVLILNKFCQSVRSGRT